jgi:hypothetical protein
MMEKLTRNQIVEHMKRKKLFGLLSGKSTTLQLLLVLDHISCTFASSFEALLLNILVSGFAKPDLSSFSAFSLASSEGSLAFVIYLGLIHPIVS